jgi:TolB protein
MHVRTTICCALLLVAAIPVVAQQAIGVFTGNNDIGAVLHKGTAVYTPSTQTYRLSGAGSNIWFNHDEFHYAWKKIKGDFILQARGVLQGKGVDPHRKFGWMVRSSLDTSAPMVAATVHGDGLTSLQYRKTAHTNIEQAQSAITSADMIQLERKGNQYIMSVARFGEPYVVEQVSSLNLGDEVYIGLFICSHNKDVVEHVTFTNVRVIVPAAANFTPYRDYIGSHIEVMDVASGHRQIVYSANESLQAPNFTTDGRNLLYNSSKGLMYRLNLSTRQTALLNTEPVTGNNNDHVISFDGKMLGLSSRNAQYNSVVYTVPITGGTPKQITPVGPSYLHGWSPDGKYLIYTAERGNNNYDIYKIPATGGKEIRLTTVEALDDGSEYSPDGKHIYFNSTRSGTMQLWRMEADGSNQQQLTFDEYNNWFPHISPDGKWICFLSYQKEVNPADHPFYKHVYLRLMPVGGGPAKVIAYLYGGQGSINTPSWSPDGKQVAFVSNTGM